MVFPLLLLGAYLLGAIPFGFLIGKAHGVDIRAHGSRNIGATNTGRVVGRRWGLVCLVLDVLKGLVPTIIAGHLLVRDPIDSGMLARWILVGVAAVLGHMLPVYLRFRGGKGVATTVGVALGLYPYYTVAMIAALMLYALVRFSTGLVSLGSLTIAVVFPAAFFIYVGLDEQATLTVCWPLGVVAILLGGMIVVRHRANIVRLLRGEELTLRAADPPPDPPASE